MVIIDRPINGISLNGLEYEQEVNMFLIHYECPCCGNKWEETYECACDSECPNCGISNIVPISFEKIKEG